MPTRTKKRTRRKPSNKRGQARKEGPGRPTLAPDVYRGRMMTSRFNAAEADLFFRAMAAAKIKEHSQAIRVAAMTWASKVLGMEGSA